MKLKLFVAVALAGTALALPVAAQTYTNAPSNMNLSSFGANGSTPIYGQVFTAPVGTLSSFTLYNSSSSATGATFAIAAWNGTGVSGANLFSATSNVVAADTVAGFYSHSVNDIGLALTQGASYFAYYTTFDVANPVSGLTFEGSATSPLGGGFRFSNSSTSPASASYNTSGVPDLRYSATFGSAMAAAMPEAATWAMMMVGMGLVGGSLRRRRTAQARIRFA